MTNRIRYAVGVPNVGIFGEPSLLVDLATAAEEAGWDGFFVWDHILYRNPKWHVADPVVVSAAVATCTSRIRFGILVNILARRRVAKVARETVTLDRLSGGRLVVGAGLGSLPAEFEAFGEAADPRTRATRLDESLEMLEALWTGKPVSYWGNQLVVRDVMMLPTPVQKPRIPVWCGGPLAEQGTIPPGSPVGRNDAAPCPVRRGRDHAAQGTWGDHRVHAQPSHRNRPV